MKAATIWIMLVTVSVLILFSVLVALEMKKQKEANGGQGGGSGDRKECVEDTERSDTIEEKVRLNPGVSVRLANQDS